MSFPGVSKHFRISCVCCLTVIRESSSSLAWSSMAGGEAIALQAVCLYSQALGPMLFQVTSMSIRSIDRVIHDSSHLDNKLFIISMLLACNKHTVKCAFFPLHPMPLGCGGTAGREAVLVLS